MKQKDLALILVVVFASAVLSLILSRLIFGSPQNRQQTVEKVDVITAEFVQPARKYFNAEAINPTKPIEIGNDSNPNPFNPQPQ
ncbi:hypothetical protein IRY61_00205 [Candidatus Saccharibacteria bacterium]|jgi:hypothetical protein|nr:hypothetical protein [Candidatus Saccharibacteria bacterium]